LSRLRLFFFPSTQRRNAVGHPFFLRSTFPFFCHSDENDERCRNLCLSPPPFSMPPPSICLFDYLTRGKGAFPFPHPPPAFTTEQTSQTPPTFLGFGPVGELFFFFPFNKDEQVMLTLFSPPPRAFSGLTFFFLAIEAVQGSQFPLFFFPFLSKGDGW